MMAKSQGTRHRKHDSRNGSTGRGKAGETAAKMMRNGRGAGKNHRHQEDTPAWQKTLGTLAIIGAVLAAAFMLGAIRIDRNVHVGNRTRQNTTETVTSPEQESLSGAEKGPEESPVLDQSDRSKKVEKDERDTEVDGSQRYSDTQAKPNITKQEGEEKDNIPVNVVSKEDDGNVKHSDNNGGDAIHKGVEKQKAVPNDNRNPGLSQEKDVHKSSDKTSRESKPKETLTKGKMVRPKQTTKDKAKASDTSDNKLNPDEEKSNFGKKSPIEIQKNTTTDTKTSSSKMDDGPKETQTSSQESKTISRESPKTKSNPEDPKSLPPTSSSSSHTKDVHKDVNAKTASSGKSSKAPKTQSQSQTKSKTEKKNSPSPPSPTSSQSNGDPKQGPVSKATGGSKDGRGAAAKKTAVPSSRAHTDQVDKELEAQLQEADKLLKKKRTDQALKKFEDLLETHPDSPKARHGKARALDQLAEERRSNDLLLNAIKWYRAAADAPDSTIEIRKGSLSRVAERLSFLGRSRKSIEVYKELVKMFPRDVEFHKSLAVQYLITGQNDKAKPYFKMMLRENPHDGFALVHLGFILKTQDNYKEAIPLLREGLDSGEPGTNEGKFFFHLGDSYLREGQVDEAYKVYDEGVIKGHFRSRYQRSLYNVDTLRAKPFWTPKEAVYTQAAKKLESNWEAIRDEALALLSESGYFQKEEEKLQDTGDWKQFTLYAQGNKNEVNCQRAPITCHLIDTIPESSGCRRGQVKFSVMHPGTHVWPHCGPTNCRLRAHLGLVVPQPVRLRVANTTRSWEEGKLFIFDDSFEHEVWQEADSLRLVLITDLWHPDLNDSQKRRLPAI